MPDRCVHRLHSPTRHDLRNGSELEIGLVVARGRGDRAILERGAVLVADTIERGDRLGGETARFDKHGIDRFLVELAVDDERS